MKPTFQFDTREFNATLEKYRKFSRRDRATICNTKAFYIARRAVVETPKTDDFKIRRVFDMSTGALAGKIINARRGKLREARGLARLKGLYGTEMKKMVATVRAARLRSIAFIKSGWIPAIKTLQKLAENPGRAPKDDSKAKVVGKPKGSATPAREGMSLTVSAIIRNAAQARGSTNKDPLGKFGLPALQKAVAFETASMKQYIEDKLRASAKEAGIKTN